MKRNAINRFLCIACAAMFSLCVLIAGGCAGNGGYVEPGAGATNPGGATDKDTSEKPGTETPG